MTRRLSALYRGGGTAEGREGGRAEDERSVNQAFIASTLSPKGAATEKL